MAASLPIQRRQSAAFLGESTLATSACQREELSPLRTGTAEKASPRPRRRISTRDRPQIVVSGDRWSGSSYPTRKHQVMSGDERLWPDSRVGRSLESGRLSGSSTMRGICRCFQHLADFTLISTTRSSASIPGCERSLGSLRGV
jgi:hypothetical protein